MLLIFPLIHIPSNATHLFDTLRTNELTVAKMMLVEWNVARFDRNQDAEHNGVGFLREYQQMFSA